MNRRFAWVMPLAALPKRHLQAGELQHLKGHSLASVAGEIGCTKPSVVELLHPGVEKVNQLLEDDAQE
jgi:hypothetical protein